MSSCTYPRGTSSGGGTSSGVCIVSKLADGRIYATQHDTLLLLSNAPYPVRCLNNSPVSDNLVGLVGEGRGEDKPGSIQPHTVLQHTVP